MAPARWRLKCSFCGSTVIVAHCDSKNCNWSKRGDAECGGYGDAKRWATRRGQYEETA
jgi:hypothetical protein